MSNQIWWSSMKKWIGATSLILLCFAGVNAQVWDRLTKPRVAVSLTHAPSLGLNVKRIAFGAARGDCADELVDKMMEMLVNKGIEVMDRQHLDSVLAEHKFNLSGYVDPQTAVELGKILGPTALLFVKVQRCATEKQSLYRDEQNNNGTTRRINISRTQAFFVGSIQTVDLATGRIFVAKTLENKQQRQNEDESGYPEFPSEFDLRDSALRLAADEVHRMFFSWSETKELIFFNDKECNLKLAFQMLQRGDREGAFRQSQENLDNCKASSAKQKSLAHAEYNVGMAHFALNHYDKALEFLNESANLKGGDIVAEAIAECRRAQSLASEAQKLEERMAVEVAKQETSKREVTASAPQTPPPETQQPVPPSFQPTASPATKPGPSVEERLKRLEELLKKGLITQKEYENKKAEILKDL
jgi:tetratricopeptide (TPR) repeat protein